MNFHYFPKCAKYIAWCRINVLNECNIKYTIHPVFKMQLYNPSSTGSSQPYILYSLTEESLYFNQHWKINKNIMLSYFYDFLKLLFSLPTTFYSPNFIRKCALDMFQNSICSPIPKSNFLYWIWINHSHLWSPLALNLRLASERKLSSSYIIKG